MLDPCGRNVDNLRISVTQECNLRCLYCHKEGETNSGKQMDLRKIQEIVKCAAELGIKNVKITGGEPLLREDIIEIIRAVVSTDGIREVCLTTNGTLLGKFAQPLKDAGTKRVNIGCDSLSSSIFGKTADTILPGLLAAKKAALQPIKLNMVVLKGLNEHEIEDMIRFAADNNVILQLIELIPVDREFHEKHYVSLGKIEKYLKHVSEGVTLRKMQARRQYHIDGTIVETVRPVHNTSFCRNCNKIRITSDGKLKPCLMRNDNLVDTSEGDLKSLFIEAINRRTYRDN